MRLACWFRRRAETIFSKKLKLAWSSTGPEKFAIARRARQHARRMRYLENTRKSLATSGYFAASASTSPISTSTFSTPSHSSLKIERRTSTVQLRKDSRAGIESAHGHRTGNFKEQKSNKRDRCNRPRPENG